MLIKPLIKMVVFYWLKPSSMINVLINVYNCNTESQQLLTTTLHKIQRHVDYIGKKNIITGEDFNFHFNSKLEVNGWKPTLTKTSIGKMIELVQPVLNCVIFGESEIQQKNVLFFVKITLRIHIAKAWLFFLSLISYTNQ